MLAKIRELSLGWVIHIAGPFCRLAATKNAGIVIFHNPATFSFAIIVLRFSHISVMTHAISSFLNTLISLLKDIRFAWI